jgi:hypothetical protein
VLVKEPGLLIKAKSALEKAITQDQHYLPAIYLLADILEKVRISIFAFYFQTFRQNIVCNLFFSSILF